MNAYISELAGVLKHNKANVLTETHFISNIEKLIREMIDRGLTTPSKTETPAMLAIRLYLHHYQNRASAKQDAVLPDTSFNSFQTFLDGTPTTGSTQKTPFMSIHTIESRDTPEKGWQDLLQKKESELTLLCAVIDLLAENNDQDDMYHTIAELIQKHLKTPFTAIELFGSKNNTSPDDTNRTTTNQTYVLQTYDNRDSTQGSPLKNDHKNNASKPFTHTMAMKPKAYTLPIKDTGTIVGYLTIGDTPAYEHTRDSKKTLHAIATLVEQRVQSQQQKAEKEIRHIEESCMNADTIADELTKKKKQLAHTMRQNIENKVTPILKKMRSKKNIDEDICALETSLRNITLPCDYTFLNPLTPQEKEICIFISQGYTTKEIAEFLHLSNRTVDFHRNKIRKKLNIDESCKSLSSYLHKKLNTPEVALKQEQTLAT